MSYPVALFLGEVLIMSPALLLIFIVVIIERRKDMLNTSYDRGLCHEISNVARSLKNKGMDLSKIKITCIDGRDSKVPYIDIHEEVEFDD